MALGVAFMLCLIASAILFAVAAAICALAWLLVRKRWPRLRGWLVAAPFVVGAMLPAVFTAGLLWLNFAPPGPRFQEVFDVPPGPNIHGLKARGWAATDAQEVNLTFSTNESGWRSLVGPPFRQVDNPDEIRDLVPMAGSEPPPWWRGHRCHDRTVHLAERLRKWEDVVVTRCRDDGRIYVQAAWIN